MNWDEAIQTISPHVVKIETPDGYGTGFLAFYNLPHEWCGIATAAHVVSHADEWQQPIKIIGDTSRKFLKEDERVIFLDRPTDSAVVLFLKGDFELPEVPIALLPMDQPCGIGIDVGWLGYPNIEPNSLCFFAGTVSARQASRKAYLIDGVAINGVSGGPVFHCPTPNNVQSLDVYQRITPTVRLARPSQGSCERRTYLIFMALLDSYGIWMKQMQRNENLRRLRNKKRNRT
jgi:hypothetical protein